MQHKLKGDDLVKVNDITNALVQYNQAISIDHNEYALSNKVLCLNKIKDYKNSVTVAADGIKKIVKFNVGTGKEDKESTLLLLKLHYRKAKAHE